MNAHDLDLEVQRLHEIGATHRKRKMRLNEVAAGDAGIRLCGEAVEFYDEVVREPIDRPHLVEEAADVLLVFLHGIQVNGVTFQEVIDRAFKKLKDIFPDGYLPAFVEEESGELWTCKFGDHLIYRIQRVPSTSVMRSRRKWQVHTWKGQLIGDSYFIESAIQKAEKHWYGLELSILELVKMMDGQNGIRSLQNGSNDSGSRSDTGGVQSPSTELEPVHGNSSTTT